MIRMVGRGWVVYAERGTDFLTAGNFTNLMTQMAGVTTIAIGVVFVLLLGEIDLSIAYVSGIAGVVVAELQVPDGSWEVKGVVAIALAVTLTALIGAIQGSFVARVSEPAALLAGASWFAIIHFRPVEYPGLFVAGLVFGMCAMSPARSSFDSRSTHCSAVPDTT